MLEKVFPYYVTLLGLYMMKQVTVMSLFLLVGTCQSAVVDGKEQKELPAWKALTLDIMKEEHRIRCNAVIDAVEACDLVVKLEMLRFDSTWYPLSKEGKAFRKRSVQELNNMTFAIGGKSVSCETMQQACTDMLAYRCANPRTDLAKAECNFVRTSLLLYQQVAKKEATNQDCITRDRALCELRLQAIDFELSAEQSAQAKEDARKKFQERIEHDYHCCGLEDMRSGLDTNKST